MKAAYYQKGGFYASGGTYKKRITLHYYFMYPGDIEGPNPKNRANYNLYILDSWVPSLGLTDVDHCEKLDANNTPTGTYIPYCCFDMGGNVNEWTSTPDIIDPNMTEKYIVRGGSYESTDVTDSNDLMRTATPQSFDPETRSNTIGFRMGGRALF